MQWKLLSMTPSVLNYRMVSYDCFATMARHIIHIRVNCIIGSLTFEKVPFKSIKSLYFWVINFYK